MVTKALVFLYLVIFPFGQLPGFIIHETLGLPFRVHLSDLVILLIGVITLINLITKKWVIPKWSLPGLEFIVIGIVILLVSPLFVGIPITVNSFLYAIRILSYILFAIYISRSFINKNLLLNSLIVIAIAMSIFGLIQYFWLPDLTAMKLFGWDDHYYRLVGTFLDPAFLGILFVLGIILSVWKKLPIVSLLLTLSLALTYSRASWLSLLIALGIFISLKFQRKLSVLILLFLLFLIPILPRPSGEGVNLQRTNSFVQKVENYEESFQMVRLSPLVGVGLNNVCEVKKELSFNISDNSCSGLDNSFVFILTTTGIIGILVFFTFIYQIGALTSNKYKVLLITSALSVFVHSLFTHTLFYPWVMGWMAILIGISRKSRSVGKS